MLSKNVGSLISDAGPIPVASERQSTHPTPLYFKFVQPPLENADLEKMLQTQTTHRVESAVCARARPEIYICVT